MIVYSIKANNGSLARFISCNDDGPTTIKSNTDKSYAYDFVYGELQYELKQFYGQKYKGKRILDVGMGNGNILKCARQLLESDVFGVDIDNQYWVTESELDKIFINTDVRDMPSELFGTFDVVYQRYFSIPFKDIPSVLLTISKIIKDDGMYYVTFGDSEFNHSDSFIFHFLKEIYENISIKEESNSYWCCSASTPRKNPVLTIPENYYYVLSEEDAKIYESARTIKEREKVLIKKNIASLKF